MDVQSKCTMVSATGRSARAPEVLSGRNKTQKHKRKKKKCNNDHDRILTKKFTCHFTASQNVSDCRDLSRSLLLLPRGQTFLLSPFIVLDMDTLFGEAILLLTYRRQDAFHTAEENHIRVHQ
jgi:hypothetical protein